MTLFFLEAYSHRDAIAKLSAAGMCVRAVHGSGNDCWLVQLWAAVFSVQTAGTCRH